MATKIRSLLAEINHYRLEIQGMIPLIPDQVKTFLATGFPRLTRPLRESQFRRRYRQIYYQLRVRWAGGPQKRDKP
jgi:hypothetical protein